MDESFPLTPNAVAVPILALITLIIDTPPFVWHIRNRNLAASSLIFWVIISNLMNFINPLIWPTDDIQHWWHGQILCDIEIKLMMAVNFGVVGSMACVMRNLAKALDTEHTILSLSKAQRRTQTIIDCLFCFGGSIYVMVIHYIVQPNRYYILAIAGCTSSFDNSWLSLVLVFIWPPIICLVDAYYSVLVVIRMHRYRKNFSEILVSSNSNLTKSRFLRLFLLSIALIVTFIPLQFYVLFANSAEPLLPYSWDLIHSPQWEDIMLIPTGGKLHFDRWIQIAVGFGVFIFFGLGQDAQALYRKCLLKVGLGRVFPGLHRQPTRRAILPTSSQTDSFGSKTRSFFKGRLFRMSMLSLHSKEDSTSGSTATLSPVEQQRGFCHLSTINENGPQAGDALSASTDSMQEKDSSPRSWLTNFLVEAHLSAPNRRWEAASNGAPVPHFGSKSNHGSDSTARIDYA